MNTTEYQTIRIWKKTAKSLKLIAALRGENMITTLDKLVERELQAAQGELAAFTEARKGKAHGKKTNGPDVQ